MLPLHLFFRSLLAALPLPSFLSIGLNRLTLPDLPCPPAFQAGVVRLTMSTLPAQWASAVVVGDGDYAFTGDFRHSLYVFLELTNLFLCDVAAHFFGGATTGSSAYLQSAGSTELVPCTLAAVAMPPWDVACARTHLLKRCSFDL